MQACSKWLHWPLRATRVARSFFSVWIPRSTTAVALRSFGRFGQLLRGTLVARIGVLVLQRFHGSLPGEDVHHHQAILRFPRVFLAQVAGRDLPSARGRGACAAGPVGLSASKRPWPASRQGRAASQVGTGFRKSSARSLSASMFAPAAPPFLAKKCSVLPAA